MNPIVNILVSFSELGEKIELLIVLFLWTIPAQLLVGFVPQEGIILYAAQHYPAMTVTGVVIGALLIAEVLNYHIIIAIGKVEWIQLFIDHESFRKTIELFNRAPFSTTVIAAFTPLPFLPVRLLAPLSGFPLAKYICAVACGRLPRIYLIALFGYTFILPLWLLIVITVVPLFYILNKIHSEWKTSFRQVIPILVERLGSIITIPNLLTASRILLVLPFIIYAIAYEYRVFAFFGIVLMGITDALDGYLARKFNMITQLGKYFDYAVDIFCLFGIGFALVYTTDLPLQFVYFLILRECIHVSCAAYLAGRGITTKSSRVATISGFFTIATYSMYLLDLPYREGVLGLTIISLLIGTIYYSRLYIFTTKTPNNKVRPL